MSAGSGANSPVPQPKALVDHGPPGPRCTRGKTQIQRQGQEQSPTLFTSTHTSPVPFLVTTPEKPRRRTRLGAGNPPLGIIISLLNSIHSAFDFFNAVSIFNSVSIPIKLSVCWNISPARFNCPYLNSLIKSIVCFQIL